MDLGKLVCLLADKALFFTCLSDLLGDDPYEAATPKAHIREISKIVQERLDLLVEYRRLISTESQVELDESIRGFVEVIKGATATVAPGFGVNCWHENAGESAAMWKLYSESGKGIAIESTVGQLKESLGNIEHLQFDMVRYSDFENDPIEVGHRHYLGFQKRGCFSYEREFRAMFMLHERGVGQNVPCDIEKLITTVWVSPYAPGYMIRAVRALCAGEIQLLKKPIIRSKLLEAPEYGFEVKLPF